MNCENCQHGGTIVPKPKIKVVQGNVLRLAIPLTLRTIMKDGDEIEYQDTDFIPSSEHPVLVVFSKGKNNFPVIATMDGNVAVVEERGKLLVGTYDITVECFDEVGQPYRFKRDMAVQVVDTTAEAGIEETIEYEAQTWYLDSAIYLATTEIGSLSEEIDRKVSDLFGYADYDANSKAIRFYDKSKTQVLTTIDATPFIADGMVENVYIDVERQVLVVVLNAEAGSRMFTVPLYLIFANYYTKTQIDNRLSTMETANFDTYVAKQSLFAIDNNVSTDKMPHLVLYSMGRPYDYVSELGIGQPYFANGYISIHTNSLQVLTIGQPSTRVVYCNAATNKLYRWTGTEFVLAGLDENVIFGAFVSGKFMRFTYNTDTREWENTSLRVVESPYAIYVEVIENKTFRFDTKDGFVLVGDGFSGGGGSLEQVQADWNQNDSSEVDFIKNKPNLATVATSGSYNDLSNKPTIPAAQVQSDWNATSGMGVILNKPSIPSKTSDLTNDSGFINRALYYGECTTAAATMPKVCTVEAFPTNVVGGVTHAKEGTVIAVKFTNSDTNTTAAPELNVNGIGAKAIMYNNAIVTSTAKNTTVAGYAKQIAFYRYDPEMDEGNGAWEYLGKNVDSNSTYSQASLGQGYAVQSNSAAATAITASISSYALSSGGIVSIKFAFDVPANATLNISSKGAKAIYNRGAAITAGVIKAGDTATFIYSTYYHLISIDRSDSVTVDSTITQNGTNPVQGGAIYSALEGASKQQTFLTFTATHDDGDNITSGTFTDVDNNTLTDAQVRALLADANKDIVIKYGGSLYKCDSINLEDSAVFSYYQFFNRRVYTLTIGLDEEALYYIETYTNYVPTTRTVNGKQLNDNIVIGMADIPGLLQAIANAGSGNVSVVQPDPADGTFIIRVGSTDYTVNLNHTHEGMAKLVVCEESELPSTLEEDTIYGVEEDGEISVLYVGGIPFYGGGGGGTSTPVLRQPADGSTIDVGKIASGESSVTKTITVKGKNLTQALTVAVTGTGYSVNKQSISAADANAGTTLTITCTSTADEAAGTLSIASSEVSCDCDLVANVLTYEDLRGVKLTGSQWLQTDYKPNANTEFRLTCRFEQSSDTMSTNKDNYNGNIFSCIAGSSNKWFYLRNLAATSQFPNNPYQIMFVNESSYQYGSGDQIIALADNPTTRTYLLVDPVEIYYTKGSSNGTIGFTDGTHTLTKPTSLKSSTQENAMMIGRTYNASNGKDMMYSIWNLTIYELVITENGNEVRHWVPKLKNGSTPGLYDTVTGTFISSETSTELVAVPLT